jgi:O-methyltransferase
MGFSTITTKLTSSPRAAWFVRIMSRMLGWVELQMIAHYHEKHEIALIKRLREEGEFLFKPSEVLILYSFAKSCATLPGVYVEVGVYQGTSAIAILEGVRAAGREKRMYLFDTFEGIPKVGKMDALFHRGQFGSSGKRSNLQIVKSRMKQYDASIHPGIFPGTGKALSRKRIAFAHLDVDVYESTRDSLNAIYSKMVPGGVIISHDYGQAEGVKAAFDEFFADKSEQVIALPMSQCLVFKK